MVTSILITANLVKTTMDLPGETTDHNTNIAATSPPSRQQLADKSKQIILSRKSLIPTSTSPTNFGAKFVVRCVSHRKVHKNGRTFQTFVLLVDTNLHNFYSGTGPTHLTIERSLDEIVHFHSKLTDQVNTTLPPLPKKKSRLTRLFSRSPLAQKDQLDKHRRLLDAYFQALSSSQDIHDNAEVINFLNLTHRKEYLDDLKEKQLNASKQQRKQLNTQRSKRFSTVSSTNLNASRNIIAMSKRSGRSVRYNSATSSVGDGQEHDGEESKRGRRRHSTTNTSTSSNSSTSSSMSSSSSSSKTRRNSKMTTEEKRIYRDRIFDEKVRRAPRSIFDAVPLEHLQGDTTSVSFGKETVVHYGLVRKVRGPGVVVPTMLLLTNQALYKLDLVRSNRIKWRLPLKDIHSFDSMARTYSLHLKTFGKNPLLPGLVEREYQCETSEHMLEWELAFTSTHTDIWQEYFESKLTVVDPVAEKKYKKEEKMKRKQLQRTNSSGNSSDGKVRRKSFFSRKKFKINKTTINEEQAQSTSKEEEEKQERDETQEQIDREKYWKHPVLPHNELYQTHYFLSKYTGAWFLCSGALLFLLLIF